MLSWWYRFDQTQHDAPGPSRFSLTVHDPVATYFQYDRNYGMFNTGGMQAVILTMLRESRARACFGAKDAE
jgi:hypothetical protein